MILDFSAVLTFSTFEHKDIQNRFEYPGRGGAGYFQVRTLERGGTSKAYEAVQGKGVKNRSILSVLAF